MCLLVLAWAAHPRYRLVVAANRDEYHERPAAPLGHKGGGVHLAHAHFERPWKPTPHRCIRHAVQSAHPVLQQTRVVEQRGC